MRARIPAIFIAKALAAILAGVLLAVGSKSSFAKPGLAMLLREARRPKPSNPDVPPSRTLDFAREGDKPAHFPSLIQETLNFSPSSHWGQAGPHADHLRSGEYLYWNRHCLKSFVSLFSLCSLSPPTLSGGLAHVSV